MSCRCHSSDLYAGLADCPKCGHRSLDRGKTWEGCERRACAYEAVIWQQTLVLLEETPEKATKDSP